MFSAKPLSISEATVFGGDPDAFAARLAYDQRNIEEELQMIDSIRRHVARILPTLPAADAFQRKVIHSAAGPLRLEQLLANVRERLEPCPASHPIHQGEAGRDGMK